MRRVRRVGLLLVAVALIGVVILVVRPFRPAALPPGATPLVLLTQPARLRLPFGSGCAIALVRPIRVERDADALVFTRVDNGERLSVVWPSGFSARLLNGRAELVAPERFVFAREGDVLSDLLGGADVNGDILICFDYPIQPVSQSRAP